MRGKLLFAVPFLTMTLGAVAQAAPDPVAPPAPGPAAPAADSPRTLLRRLERSIQASRPDTVASLFTEPFAARMLATLTAADRLGAEAARLLQATRARFGSEAAASLRLDGAMEPYRPFSGELTIEGLDWNGGPQATARITTKTEGQPARPTTLRLLKLKSGWRIVPATGKALEQQLLHLDRLARISEAAAGGFARLAEDVAAGRVDSVETLTKRRDAIDALALRKTAPERTRISKDPSKDSSQDAAEKVQKKVDAASGHGG